MNHKIKNCRAQIVFISGWNILTVIDILTTSAVVVLSQSKLLFHISRWYLSLVIDLNNQLNYEVIGFLIATFAPSFDTKHEKVVKFCC